MASVKLRQTKNNGGFAMVEPITFESWTLVTLLLHAVARVNTQAIFDRDPYESRRDAMPGSRLLKSLILYQMLKTNSQRGIVRASEESKDIQQALGGQLFRNTLSNAIAQRDLDQMLEAWMLILHHYDPLIGKAGKKFARIAAVDASLIKLSLQAFDWAKYREKTGAVRATRKPRQAAQNFRLLTETLNVHRFKTVRPI